ncbi:hypothetical protein NUV89_17780 [Pseudomonas sp. 18.1.10]|uniref:hypothetical protein n=2 Tax=unclassified Pseudomonas TaxID=196821 RepID=UPI00214FBA11|nr:hypothetical protein [Pseudomonas sp. 18.1.10]MCR4540240.1 hypothetical protein [Pseudomonas sp. 18.1.10]
MLMLSPLACAQERTSSPINNFVPATWIVQAPEPRSKITSVHIDGMAAHADETSIAILQVACYRSPLRPVISLYTHTDELRFNPSIYEGKRTRPTDPLSLTTGALPAHTYPVNGYYSAEHPQPQGALFKFTMPANRRELREWISADMAGHPIKIKLPSAVRGGTPLTAVFLLPHDNGGLREVITPCLNNRKTPPKKPS